MQTEYPQYKKIKIQNLEPRPQFPDEEVTQKELIGGINNKYRYRNNPIHCYKDTGLKQERVISSNQMFRVSHFFEAFLIAYTQHGDIVLVPDEIWIMISFYLSKYIDQNSEKLRKKLVHHEGVKELIVFEQVQDLKESMLRQENWDSFFEAIIKLIKKNTVKGVVQAFQCDFSTTNETYRLISTCVVMNTMKNFFKYIRLLGGCGINNVYMAGNKEDWEKMITKLESMIQFDVDGKLKKYIKHMRVILKKFLQTFEGKPDIAWWNTIMTTPQKRKVYGGQQLEIEGWILHFYGMYGKEKLSGFPQFTIKVPITLVNLFTKKQKELMVVSDWISVSKLDSRTYKPDLGMYIVELEQNETKKQVKN